MKMAMSWLPDPKKIYMWSSFGCVLQFDMPTAMKAATCRVIYKEGIPNNAGSRQHK
jgi:hypothetical protein